MRIEAHHKQCSSLEQCPCAKRAVFIQNLYRDWCRAHQKRQKTLKRKNTSHRRDWNKYNKKQKRQKRHRTRSAYSTSCINTKDIKSERNLFPKNIKKMGKPSMSIADIILKLLNEYNVSQLIEDCNHIDIAHCNDNNEPKYISIFEFFENELGQCTAECNIYSRSNRNRENDSDETNRKKLYYGFINGNDVAIITTLDTFHSFWFHSKALYAIDAEQSYKRLQALNENNEEKYENDEKEAKTHHNASKFITTIEIDTEEKGAIANFDFGEHFEYWSFYEKYDNFICARYCSLKEELLNNEIKNVDVAIYNDIDCKINLLIKTNYVKQMGAHRNFYNEIANIAKDDIIGREHLICIMIYTNHSDIQKKYKSTLRLPIKMRKERTESDYIRLKERNSEIAHWCRLLFESVRFWGNIMTEKDAFFHGIDRTLLFDRFYAAFKCPISTTTQISVAQSFKENPEGIIMKVSCASEKCMIPFLDVAFISDFRMESERLFYGADLQIIDIYYKKSRFDYMLRALSLFQHILSGGFFTHNTMLMNKSNQKRLISLIENYLKYYDKKELIEAKTKKKKKKKKQSSSIPVSKPKKKRKYHQELFDFCIKSRQNSDIWLCLTEITAPTVLSTLSKYFLDHKSPGNFVSFVCSKWNINVKYSQEFDWCIHQKNFDTFMCLPKGDLIQSPRYLYSLINNDKQYTVLFCAECCRWSKDDPGWTDFYWNCEQIPNGVSEIQVTLDVMSQNNSNDKNIVISHDIYEGEWMSTDDEEHSYFGGKAFEIMKEFYGNNYYVKFDNIPPQISQFKWRMAVRVSTIAYTPKK